MESNPGPPVSTHMYVDHPSNNYASGMLVGCLTYDYLTTKLLHAMPSVVAFYLCL